jgi:hypothetical protein
MNPQDPARRADIGISYFLRMAVFQNPDHCLFGIHRFTSAEIPCLDAQEFRKAEQIGGKFFRLDESALYNFKFFGILWLKGR